MRSRCISSFMTAGSSLTPLRSTVWQPSGMPASASMPRACTAAGEDGLESPVIEQQRVAARHDDVADLGVLFEVLKRTLELRHRDLLRISHLAAAGAEPAVAGA